MSEPEWIRDDVVLAIHSMQIAEHGGKDGVLSEGALDASLANPKHYFFYTEPKPDIPAIASRYAHSITANHPFCDGNKRTAAVACELFLELNGYELDASDEDAYAMYIRLASSEIGADEFAQWLRRHSKRAG
jgi:death-on-curing protein